MKIFMFAISALLILSLYAHNCFAQNEPAEKRFAISAGSYLTTISEGSLKLMGADLSVRLYNSLYGFAGFGFTPDYNYLNIGAYYLFLNPDDSFRPKLLVKYGPNSGITFIRTASTGQVLGKYTQFDAGTAIGAGFDWLPLFNRSLGFDFYIGYALSNNKEAKYLPANVSKFDKIESKIAFYLALKYAFTI